MLKFTLFGNLFFEPVQPAVGDLIQHVFDQFIAQRDQFIVFLFHFLDSDLGCGAETDDPRHIFGRGAPAALLPAAVQKRRYLCSLANIERANAFRPVKLMGGN